MKDADGVEECWSWRVGDELGVSMWIEFWLMVCRIMVQHRFVWWVSVSAFRLVARLDEREEGRGNNRE